MGANNFVAFATVPAGAQVGPKTSVDLWTLIPSTGLDPGFNVMCTGEFVGTIAVEASLDGVQFNPVGYFTLGKPQLVGPFEPTFELAPVVVDEVVRYMRLRVMPGTSVTSPIFVTAGGAANCNCDTGGGGGPDPYDLDPENVDNLAIGPGVSADYSRGDHVHGLEFASGEGEEPENVLPSTGSPDFGTNPRPAREDHVHILDASVITGYLSELYALGLATSDANNTLDGSYFNLFFNDEGGIEVNQSPVTSGVDFDSHPAFRWFRNFDTFAQVGLMGTHVTKYNQFATPDTVQGGGFMRFDLMANNNAVKTAATFGWELRYPSPVTGYVPNYIPNFGIPNQTEIGWSLLNRRDGGAAYSNVLFNSDGGHYRDVLLISGVTAYRYNATELQMTGEFSGAFAPALGSELAYDQVTVGVGAGPGGLELGHASVILDSENLGSAQATGHMEWWLRGPALGDAVQRAMALHAPNATILSSTDCFAFSYNKTTDKLDLSVNAGPYEAVLTSPSGTIGSVVDLASASTDFKTATTFTIVPTVARRFMPIAAYIEFTTITALATGPSVKIGNNGAHDNVAPTIVVANTAVTDNFLPFVMATIPQIIDLTATGIIGEMVVNAAGTTCTGRVHVVGVYIT